LHATTGSGNSGFGFDALYNSTAGANTGVGYQALYANTSGTNNTAVGYQALDANTTGTNNTAIGYGADVSTNNLTNATAIGYNAVVTASNTIRLGNSSIVEITAAVNGLNTLCDRTKKEDFRPVDGEETLARLRVVPVTTWNYIGQDPKVYRHYGPMAQDFYAAFGVDSIGSIGTDKTINSGDLTGVLMAATQALEHRSATQADTIEALSSENNQLHAKLKALEAKVDRVLLRDAK